MFSKGYMSPIFHEIFGIILLILVIIHLILNKHYLKNLFKGSYNFARYIMLFVNIGFFISFFLSIIFGILSSQELLKFMNIGNIEIVNLHKIVSYICLIFTGIHMGINFDVMLKMIEKEVNNIIIYVIKIIIIGYGIYAFIKQDILSHILGKLSFSFYDGSILVNIIRYVGIILMISIIVNFIKRLRKRGKVNG